MAARRRRAGAWVRPAGGSGGGNSRLEGMGTLTSFCVFSFGHSELQSRSRGGLLFKERGRRGSPKPHGPLSPRLDRLRALPRPPAPPVRD